MDRRKALEVLASISVGAFAAPALGSTSGPLISKYGATQPARPIPGPRFYATYPFKGLGKQLAKEGKNVLLYRNLQKEIGEIVPHYQGRDPETGESGEGDCCGHAGAMGCDVLAATDIHLRDEAERFIAKASVEMLYAGSRIEIGQTENNGKNNLKDRGGSHGGWIAKFVKDYGVLHRLPYRNPADGSTLDLTGYHPGRSRQYRDVGVPDWLEPIAREHPCKMATNIKTGMEGVDAICAGHPIVACSSYAFEDTRDARGFAKAYEAYRKWGRWYRKQWWHAMIATGVVFYPDVTGVLIQNSHGIWNSGPRPHDMPEGSFFVTLDTWDKMVRDWDDCWAIGSYAGHEVDRIKHRIHRLWR